MKQRMDAFTRVRGARLSLAGSLNTKDVPGWRAALDDIVCDVVR